MNYLAAGLARRVASDIDCATMIKPQDPKCAGQARRLNNCDALRCINSATLSPARNPVAKRIIAIHLDFKGMNFKPAYIPQLFADLASQGINTVLAEYEDIFPFEGFDLAYDKSNIWTQKTLDAFLAAAKKNKIDIIPLQQCLGHLEYVYRWERYRKFAEDRKYPSTVCLTNDDAKAMIFNMLQQVIAAHPECQYVHLGMDEAHALVAAAKRLKCDVIDVFLQHLESLCEICEAHGKTPMIWSDMLEDHFKPGVFDRFKSRVVLVPWDYASSGERIGVGRISGFRASKHWLEHPEDPAAPTLGKGHTFIEDLKPAIAKMVTPDLDKNRRAFRSMFQADMWGRLGFRVLGASAIRCSTNFSTMPRFNFHTENIRAWSRAVERSDVLGQVGTSWARGTTWCPPGFCIDLTWPLIAELARSMGAKPKPFFTGIPASTVSRLIRTLGRCRDDWRLEGKVAAEMEALSPKVKSHRFEWDSIALMTRVMELQRRGEYAQLEVDFFHANERPVDSEWQRRLHDQAEILRDIAAMKKRVVSHFGKRYEGEGFEEWVRDLFDLHEARLREAGKICRRKMTAAKRRYR